MLTKMEIKEHTKKDEENVNLEETVQSTKYSQEIDEDNNCHILERRIDWIIFKEGSCIKQDGNILRFKKEKKAQKYLEKMKEKEKKIFEKKLEQNNYDFIVYNNEEYSKNLFNQFKTYILDVKQIFKDFEKVKENGDFFYYKLKKLNNIAKILTEQEDESKDDYRNSFDFVKDLVKREVKKALDNSPENFNDSKFESFENIRMLRDGNGYHKDIDYFKSFKIKPENHLIYKSLCLFYPVKKLEEAFNDMISNLLGLIPKNVSGLFDDILGIAAVEYLATERGVNLTLNGIKEKKIENPICDSKIIENICNYFDSKIENQEESIVELVRFFSNINTLKNKSKQKFKKWHITRPAKEVDYYLQKNPQIQRFVETERNNIKNNLIQGIVKQSLDYCSVSELKRDFNSLKRLFKIAFKNDDKAFESLFKIAFKNDDKAFESLLYERENKLLTNYVCFDEKKIPANNGNLTKFNQIKQLLYVIDKCPTHKDYEKAKDLLNYIDSKLLENIIVKPYEKEFFIKKPYSSKGPSNGIYVPKDNFKNINNNSKSKYIPEDHLKKSFGRNLKKNLNRH